MKEVEVVIGNAEEFYKGQRVKLTITENELDTILKIVLRNDADVLIRNVE